MMSHRGANTRGLHRNQTSEQLPKPTVVALKAPISVVRGGDRPTTDADP